MLAPLQAVIGVVERRQTMPVPANVLAGSSQGQLSITGTDLEVELVASTEVGVQEPGISRSPAVNSWISCARCRRGSRYPSPLRAKRWSSRRGAAVSACPPCPPRNFP